MLWWRRKSRGCGEEVGGRGFFCISWNKKWTYVLVLYKCTKCLEIYIHIYSCILIFNICNVKFKYFLCMLQKMYILLHHNRNSQLRTFFSMFITCSLSHPIFNIRAQHIKPKHSPSPNFSFFPSFKNPQPILHNHTWSLTFMSS